MQSIRAFQNPHEAHRPRLRRQVLSFKQALENLKHAKSGSVRCAAIHTYGRCLKEIHFAHLHFLALLDQLSIANEGSVVELMPLMLCPTHWKMTEYYIAMFLDSFSFIGSKLDTQDYENIVIDLESAKLIKEEEGCSPQETSVPSNATAGDQGRYGSATSSTSEGEFFLNGSNIQIPTSRVNNKLPFGPPSTAPSTQSSNTTAGFGDEKGFQTQDHPSGGDQPADAAANEENADVEFLETGTLTSLHFYASLELGVAKLEIMYQKSLRCISMALYGWRCQELIRTERLLQARGLLSSLGDSKEELEGLAKLVLCPGHARGKLAELYSETWSAFAAKRLPKKEAISRFDPEHWKLDHWKSIQFVNDHNTLSTEPKKTKSTSSLPQTRFKRAARSPREGTEVDSKLSAPAPRSPRGNLFGSLPSNYSFTFKSEMPKSPASFRSETLSKTPPTAASSIFLSPGMPTPIPLPVPAPAADFVGTPDDHDDVANDRHANSRANTVHTGLVSDRSTSPSLSPEVKFFVPRTISPTGSIIERVPPIFLGVSSDVSDLSSEFAETRLSGDTSSYDCRSSVNTADAEDTTVSEATRSDEIPQPPHDSAPPIFRRSLNLKVPIVFQGEIDGNIVKEICSSIPGGGYVYIFKSLGRNMVKIGKATDVARRKHQIRTGCQLEDLDEVESGSYHVKYPERVEKLVHHELVNFRVKFICQHLRGNSSQEIEQEHREWFDVPEEVAVQSVQRWRAVVEDAYTREGTIRENWASKMALMPKPSRPERSYLKTGLDESNKSHLDKHHQLRHERYRNWIGDTYNQWE